MFKSYLVGKRFLGTSSEYLNGGRESIKIPTDSKIFGTLANQHLTQLGAINEATNSNKQ